MTLMIMKGKVDIGELLKEGAEISVVADHPGDGLQPLQPQFAATRPAKVGIDDTADGSDIKRLQGHHLRKMIVQAENEVKRLDNVLAISQRLTKEVSRLGSLCRCWTDV